MQNIKFRLATKSDVDFIMEIIEQAQSYLRKNNIDQWQNNYPNKKVILNDIYNKDSYVVTKDNKVIATAAILFEPDQNYNKIHKGQWINNDEYITIHRIAIDNQYKGLNFASLIISEAESLSRSKNIFSIRIDTHKDNKAMNKFLLKNDFNYCGIIYLEDGNRRLAYEKIIT